MGTQSVSLPTEAEVRSRAIRHESEKELEEPLVLCFQYSTALPDLKLSVYLSTAYPSVLGHDATARRHDSPSCIAQERTTTCIPSRGLTKLQELVRTFCARPSPLVREKK